MSSSPADIHRLSGKLIYKTCPCCQKMYTFEEWDELYYVGHQASSDDEFEYLTEMRNCTCGSTIGVESRRAKEKSA